MGDDLPRTEAGTFGYRPSLLVVTVCDIRDFTGLTFRVHEYINSREPSHTEIDEIKEKYLKYVQNTQRVTEDILANGLTKGAYATKSTGDGFLIAHVIPDFSRTNPGKARTAQQRFAEVEAFKVLSRAIGNLINLITDNNSIESKGKLRTLTQEFLHDYAARLGLDEDWYRLPPPHRRSSLFKLGGAITMGQGYLVSRKGEFVDAFGHCVNLAFRLCGRAYRYDPKSGSMSPEILVAREAGRLYHLNQNGRQYAGFIPDPLRLKDWVMWVYDEEIELKGIEEEWCYMLKRATAPPAK